MNKQEIEKAIKHLEKRNFWLKANPVCQRIQSRVDKQNYEIVRNELAISALTQQLNDGWIPVSERLPEIRQLYDVSLRYENFSGIYEITRMADYIGDGEWNIYGPQPVIATRHIMAWKNRTEAYKEVSNG